MSGRETEGGLTILHLLSWLNYGGVESYVIRLGRALRGRGHRVLVASAGGKLLPELEAAGLPHFQLDFTGPRLLSGAGRLRRLLEEQSVDLVHAHNWRAGLVAHLACRRAGVPRLLTIHGVRRPFLRRSVFYWSDPVAVVSEASRDNLVRDFGLPAERVVVTRIGVDCEQFRPGPPDGDLLRELGLAEGAPRVVHVSRFSRGKAKVARALIACLPELESTVPGVELLLAGEGPERDAIAGLAEEMNARLGRRAVIALGGRRDVPRLLSLASAVAATATAALEAMAAGKPVIAAGKGGYVGPVCPHNLEAAERSCFGDHGRAAPLRAETLARDLAALLRDPDEMRRAGEFCRETARARHSMPRVAKQMESLYRRVVCDPAEVRRLVVFHLNQIGDLMFTLPALKALRAHFPHAHITSVLRAHLAGLVAHSGFVDQVVPRPAGGPAAALALGRRLRRTRPDLAITLSQSATMALCAWWSGAPHRVGYVDSDLARLLTHRVQVRGIPCPEKVLRLLRALMAPVEKRDYVGLVRLAERDRAAGERMLEECGCEGAGPLIALAPGEAGTRPYKAWFPERFAETARGLAEALDARLVVVGGEGDRALGEQILAGLGARGCNLAGKTSPAQLAAVLGRCDLLIGIDSGPMHLAAAMGRPVAALFGPTDPGRTGPMGEGHEVIFHRQECWRPCIHPMIPKSCDRRCMEAITVDEVIAAAGRIIARGGARGAKEEGGVRPPH